MRRIDIGRLAAAAVLVVAAVAYVLLSVANHVHFRTFGLDLGLYTHALYEYAHLLMPDCSFFMDSDRSLLSDHFDLYLPLLSPLVYLLGQYTLPLVQVAAVLFGGVGVYRLIGTYTDRWWVPLAAMASFFSFFGIWHALAFDYHSNVVATMLVPWMMLALRRRRYGSYAVWLALVCVAKETMPLWMCFVLVALMWDYRREREALCWLGGGMLFCVGYLLLVTQVLMPAMCADPAPGFWRYGYMGGNLGEVATWLLSHPLEALKQLVADPSGLGQKKQFFLCMAVPCGLLCLWQPNWLLMLVPLVAQKMLSADEGFWGIGNQYNVEFAAVVVPAAFIAISRWRSTRLQGVVAAAVLLLTIRVTVYTCHQPRTWIREDNVRIFSKEHYRNNVFDSREARRLISTIPPDASVCASSCLTPHLALRPEVYCYPAGQQAEYLMLAEDGDVVLFHQKYVKP